jgi:hypothetical protein
MDDLQQQQAFRLLTRAVLGVLRNAQDGELPCMPGRWACRSRNCWMCCRLRTGAGLHGSPGRCAIPAAAVPAATLAQGLADHAAGQPLGSGKPAAQPLAGPCGGRGQPGQSPSVAGHGAGGPSGAEPAAAVLSVPAVCPQSGRHQVEALSVRRTGSNWAARTRTTGMRRCREHALPPSCRNNRHETQTSPCKAPCG